MLLSQSLPAARRLRTISAARLSRRSRSFGFADRPHGRGALV